VICGHSQLHAVSKAPRASRDVTPAQRGDFIEGVAGPILLWNQKNLLFLMIITDMALQLAYTKRV
jgi:hypothetical protein